MEVSERMWIEPVMFKFGDGAYVEPDNKIEPEGSDLIELRMPQPQKDENDCLHYAKHRLLCKKRT